MPAVPLTVVSQQRWRAEELAPYIDVRADFGLDTAAGGNPDGALWCPGAWAAAATVRHPQLRLSSAGARWIDNLPLELSGRESLTDTAGNWMRRLPAPAGARIFAKLPETKHEPFPALVRTTSELRNDLAALPRHELVSVQTPVRFVDEVRCWVRDGNVVAHSPYFPDADRADWSSLGEPQRGIDAATWLSRNLSGVAIPPAVVIDVGWCTDPVIGRPGWRVIEANAPWSSDWYVAADLIAVLKTVVASQTDVPDRWRWTPSPLLVERSVALARR